MKEKITLITCTYGRLEVFRNLLISLKNQTLLPDEFIVSDDGSKEDVLGLLQEEFKELKEIKIKFIKQEDLGFRASRARNNGAREAIGDLLIFIDSDIVMPPKFLEIFKKKVKKNTVGLSRALRLTKKNSEKITKQRILENNFKDLYSKENYLNNISRYYKNYFYSLFLKEKQAGKFRTMAFALYKEDYIRMDGFNENFIGWGFEDVDFGKRALDKGIKIVNTHNNNFQYHQWHNEFKTEEEAEENNRRVGQEVEYGYSKTYGSDKYEVIEL